MTARQIVMLEPVTIDEEVSLRLMAPPYCGGKISEVLERTTRVAEGKMGRHGNPSWVAAWGMAVALTRLRRASWVLCGGRQDTP